MTSTTSRMAHQTSRWVVKTSSSQAARPHPGQSLALLAVQRRYASTSPSPASPPKPSSEDASTTPSAPFITGKWYWPIIHPTNLLSGPQPPTPSTSSTALTTSQPLLPSIPPPTQESLDSAKANIRQALLTGPMSFSRFVQWFRLRGMDTRHGVFFSAADLGQSDAKNTNMQEQEKAYLHLRRPFELAGQKEGGEKKQYDSVYAGVWNRVEDRLKDRIEDSLKEETSHFAATRGVPSDRRPLLSPTGADRIDPYIQGVPAQPGVHPRSPLTRDRQEVLDGIPFGEENHDPTFHRAWTGFFSISRRKLQMLADLVKRMPLEEAILQMRFSPKASAHQVLKCLEGAREQAKLRGFRMDHLVVDEVWVGKGLYSREQHVKGRGRTGIMHHATAALYLVLRETHSKQDQKLITATTNLQKRIKQGGVPQGGTRRLPGDGVVPSRVRQHAGWAW